MTAVAARLVCAITTLCLFASAGHAQASTSPPNHNPDFALLSTADIDLFWQAYDEWKTSANAAPDQLAIILDRDYIKKGSPGVQDFIPHRIINGEALAKEILADLKYYEDVRANTLKMQSFEPEIRKGFEHLKRIYPEAVFPPVYFVVGRRNSGGTDSENGLIIGAEMFADTGSRVHLSEVTSIVIHELIHYQQKTQGSGLIAQAMKEGAADFIAELITGTEIDEDAKAYGDSHEEELWKRFQEDVKNDNMKPWLYNSGDKRRAGPPDLGYYIGYKICQSFYEISRDKAAALRMIVAMKYPQAIIDRSGYARRFH